MVSSWGIFPCTLQATPKPLKNTEHLDYRDLPLPYIPV